MSTWIGPPVHELPPANRLSPVWAIARILLIIGLTLLCVAIFMPLRFAQRFMPTLPIISLLAGFWSKACLRLLGIKTEVRGTALRSGGVMVANHSTWLDILALRTGPFLTFIAKSEVESWPGVGPLARLNGTMFVTRKSTAAKAQEIEMTERLSNGEQLVFFPEGTSSDGRRLLPFKSALFAAFSKPPLSEQLLVQPVSVAWIAPANQPKTFFGWWGDMSFEGSIWEIATRCFGAKVIVTWHKPLRPTDFSNRKALAAACEAAVAQGLRDAGISPLPVGKDAWGTG